MQHVRALGLLVQRLLNRGHLSHDSADSVQQRPGTLSRYQKSEFRARDANVLRPVRLMRLFNEQLEAM